MQQTQRRHRYFSRFYKTFLPLLLLFLLAFAIRLYSPRVGGVFLSSDEIYLFQYSLKPLSIIYTPSFDNFFVQLFRFFNFPWGWGTIFLSTAGTAIVTLFGLSITEFTITLPYIIVGSATVVLVYLTGKEIKGKLYGFIAALLIAFLPLHIIISRTIVGNIVSGIFFFFLSLFLFIKYFKTQKEFYRILGHIVVAYYFITENQAIGIIVVLLCTSFLYCQEKHILSRVIESIRQLISCRGCFFAGIIVLPTLFSALYLFMKGLSQQSYLNLSHSKPLMLGFYLQETVKSISKGTGTALFFLLIIGFFYYFLFYFLIPFLFRKEKEKSLLFLSYFFGYGIPWFFLIQPYINTSTNGYHLHITVSLIFIAAHFVEDIILFCKKIHTAYFKIFYGMALLITFSFVALYTSLVIVSEITLNQDIVPISLINSGFEGENIGIKTIGYYIRGNTPRKTVVLTDVELFVAQYYFGRNVSGELDLTPQETKMLFEKTLADENINYVFIKEDNLLLLNDLLKISGFVPRVYAVQKSEVKGILFMKSELLAEQEVISERTPIILDIETYDPLFDQKYGTVQALFVDYE
jgi:hypothetical protein